MNKNNYKDVNVSISERSDSEPTSIMSLQKVLFRETLFIGQYENYF